MWPTVSRHDIAAIWAFSRWLRTGVSFIGCESRWNGGPVIGGGCVDCLHATHEDDRGGVKVNGAAMLQFVGGICEHLLAVCRLPPQLFDGPVSVDRRVQPALGVCLRLAILQHERGYRPRHLYARRLLMP